MTPIQSVLRSTSRRPNVAIAVAALAFSPLGAAACQQHEDPNRLRATGLVEATDVRLAPEVGGRIVA